MSHILLTIKPYPPLGTVHHLCKDCKYYPTCDCHEFDAPTLCVWTPAYLKNRVWNQYTMLKQPQSKDLQDAS